MSVRGQQQSAPRPSSFSRRRPSGRVDGAAKAREGAVTPQAVDGLTGGMSDRQDALNLYWQLAGRFEPRRLFHLGQRPGRPGRPHPRSVSPTARPRRARSHARTARLASSLAGPVPARALLTRLSFAFLRSHEAGVSEAWKADKDPRKINLGVGQCSSSGQGGKSPALRPEPRADFSPLYPASSSVLPGRRRPLPS
jgi:hypothetical protein